jgi:hypothetical protein
MMSGHPALTPRKPVSTGSTGLPDLPPEDWKSLAHAKYLLETPDLTARMAHLIGAPIESTFQRMPAGWRNVVHKTTHSSLMAALKLAVKSMGDPAWKPSSDRFHKILSGTSGAIGGAFGFAAVAIELPISTTLILRSIADIARSEQHDLTDLQTRLACMEVFALGGNTTSDDAAENGYWVVRATLAKSLSEAAIHFTRKGILDETAPVMVRLISAIASKFGIIISEQLAAKVIPLIGATTGSAINLLFMNHFQKMARGHFILRRLESTHGISTVREVYDSIALPLNGRQSHQPRMTPPPPRAR